MLDLFLSLSRPHHAPACLLAILPPLLERSFISLDVLLGWMETTIVLQSGSQLTLKTKKSKLLQGTIVELYPRIDKSAIQIVKSVPASITTSIPKLSPLPNTTSAMTSYSTTSQANLLILILPSTNSPRNPNDTSPPFLIPNSKNLTFFEQWPLVQI